MFLRINYNIKCITLFKEKFYLILKLNNKNRYNINKEKGQK